MNKKYEKIGVFDSGLGATTALKELERILPYEKFLYYGDSKNAPYGAGKTAEEIQKLCEPIIEFFIKNNCKIVLMPCNTADIAALNNLKEKYKNIKIFGIIDYGVKSALKVTKNNKVAVISTKFTKETNVYKSRIQNFNKDIEVVQIACVEFASMIEKGWENFENRDELLRKYLSEIPDTIDTLILGCTHYPLIRTDIEKYFKKNIVDPAIEMAEDIKNELESLGLLNDDCIKKETTFFITGELEDFVPTAEKFLNKKIEIYKI